MINYSKLLELLGDTNLVDKYIALVKIEIPKELNQLKTYISNENYEEASVVAHSIKSQCNYMGLDACTELAFKIEKQTELNTVDGLRITFKLLQSNLKSVLEELKH